MGVAQLGEQAVAYLFKAVIKASVVPFHPGVTVGQVGVGAHV